jgi:hypothetical protein
MRIAGVCQQPLEAVDIILEEVFQKRATHVPLGESITETLDSPGAENPRCNHNGLRLI